MGKLCRGLRFGGGAGGGSSLYGVVVVVGMHCTGVGAAQH